MSTIVDRKQVTAALPRWEVKTPLGLRPGSSAKRMILWFVAGIAIVLFFVWLATPNLLRSRIAANRASEFGRQGQFMTDQARLQTSAGRDRSAETMGQIELPAPLPTKLISYQASMTIEVKEFDDAKTKLRQIMDAEGGYVAQANFVETPNQPKQANLVLRVPAAKLATILNQVRELGRVRKEDLNSEEVTEQVVDLEARLKNARSTEQRLIDVLNNRTGKVGDILQVEQEIARTREQIERMEAQRQNLMKRVEMATVTLSLAEEFKAELQPAPLGTLRQLRNALVDGWENFSGSILAIVFFLARYGLSLVLWAGLGWVSWRLVRGPLIKLARHGE
ncbi:MAG: DUF4349 domain-containing protein [Terriglobia bacterium]